MPCFPSASGPHASDCTLASFISASAWFWAKKGCSSTWLTAGVILALATRSVVYYVSYLKSNRQKVKPFLAWAKSAREELEKDDMHETAA